MKLTRYMPAAAAILAWTAFAGSAYADITFDNINGAQTPGPYTSGNDDLGWVYSPTLSYQLSGITLDFSAVGVDGQSETLSFWTANPSSGGTLLGSGTFASGAGFLGVTFGTDISITAGDTYFVGVSNTNGVGVPIVAAAFTVTSSVPAAPGVTYIPSGFYTDSGGATFNVNVPLDDTSCPGGGSCDNAFAAPIIDFQGHADTSGVPEPGTLALSMTGVLALLLAWGGKRHAASRRDL